jgi:threonyl-tRNA synthetase
MGVGPAIEDGFYYDFKFPKPITEADLPAIEARMRKIIARKLPFEMLPEKTLDAADARLAADPFKRELFDEFRREGRTITFAKLGAFVDLCRGGHVKSTAELPADAFKLLSLAGAYWRGDAQKPQLQRIYGTAWKSKADLDAYLVRRAEAEARDHRKIGAALDLFSFDPVAPGAAFWHPNGMVIWNELEKLLRDNLIPAGYREVQTPLMVKPELFRRSGHLAHYKGNMFRVLGTDEEFYLKPMNCPESAVIFAARAWSYRDLPLRLSEIGRIHRNELSGTLGGLFRVRQITQDDGHIYCRPDQLEHEITNVLKLSKRIYTLFGLTPDFFLSTKPDTAMGDAKLWDKAEHALKAALEKNKLPFRLKPKEGTFYAPKIDIDVTDSIGRRWQLCTIQADLVMVPSLPGVEYTDAKGKKQKPVVIHRAIFGSFERFIGILTEHFAGAFPLWLAPTQVQIIPVGAKFEKLSATLAAEFAAVGLRVRVDAANETVGYRIRKTEQQKIPYTLVLGEKEAVGTKLAVRVRGKKEIVSITKAALLKKVQTAVLDRALTLPT